MLIYKMRFHLLITGCFLNKFLFRPIPPAFALLALIVTFLFAGSYSCVSTTPVITPKNPEENEQIPEITNQPPPRQESSVNQNKIPTSVSHEYRIGMPDELVISVWKEPTLKTTTSVRPDGKISFPLIDDVFADGLTVEELKQKISKRLERYIINPLVHVSVKNIKSRRVLVMGAVKDPKVLQLTHPITIMEAITKAGGMATEEIGGAEVGDLDNAYITRNNVVLDIDFKRLIRESDMSQNIYLQKDDVIYIPYSISPGSEVYVFGEVNSPAAIPLKTGTKVFEAIARAGGFVEDTANYIKVVRGNLKNPEIIDVDMKKFYNGDIKQNILLKHHDVLYITATPLTKFARFMTKILTGINTLYQLSYGIIASDDAFKILKNIH